MNPTWERVYTVNDYYDGPRRGVADFGGKPHIYEARFSNVDDEYTGQFYLMEIDSELFSLVMEDWSIWLRWCEAFERGETTQETHPALPSDRQRHEKLQQLIGNRLKADPEKSQVVDAEFRVIDKKRHVFEVQWRHYGRTHERGT